jgi:FlaG/FlaF family flagellin (archaellin)
MYWGSVRFAMGVAITVGAAALIVGWHFSQAHMAHRAIPGRRAQLGPLRKDRTHHLMWVVGIVVLIVVIFIAVVR